MDADRESAASGEAAATAGETADAAIARLLHDARVHLGMHTAFVSEFSGGDRLFRHVDSALAEPPVAVGGGGPLADSYCARVADGRLPGLIADARAVPEAAALPATAATPVGAHVSVPIRFSDGRVFGTFCCFDARPDPTLQPRDLALVRMPAEQVGRLLERRAGIERSRREARSLVERDLQPQAIIPHYQPIVRLHDGGVAGYEALSRFATPPSSPLRHFDAARHAGMGTALERAAFAAAVAAAGTMPGDSYLSVNFSPQALLDAGTIDALLACGIDRLAVELTEHAAVPDYPGLTATLRRLQAAGIRIAVDDAGAGFASLTHILELHPDVIKLDRSLVGGVATDPARRALAQALVSFAGRTGAQLVAEGIEADADLDALRRLGVGFGQGFVFGRPAPWFAVPER